MRGAVSICDKNKVVFRALNSIPSKQPPFTRHAAGTDKQVKSGAEGPYHCRCYAYHVYLVPAFVVEKLSCLRHNLSSSVVCSQGGAAVAVLCFTHAHTQAAISGPLPDRALTLHRQLLIGSLLMVPQREMVHHTNQPPQSFMSPA